VQPIGQRWVDGSLEYDAVLPDNKGKAARYFSRRLDNRPPRLLASFHVTFYDEAGFPRYEIYIHDRSFSKVGNSANFESFGKQPCTEKLYRTLLTSPLALAYSTELDLKKP